MAIALVAEKQENIFHPGDVSVSDRTVGISGVVLPKPISFPVLSRIDIPWMSDLRAKSYPMAPCSVCSRDDFDIKGKVIINGFPFFVVQCKYDTHIQTEPRPDLDYITELYQGEYFYPEGLYPREFSQQVGIPDRGQAEVIRRQGISKMQVDEWIDAGIIDPAEMQDKKNDRNWGGAGYLSHEAKSRGMEVLNIELCEDKAQESLAKGVPAYHGTLEQAMQDPAFTLEAESRDLVACYDLLEHILEPNEFLETIARVIKPGGHIAIRVPQTPEKEDPTLHLVDHVNHFIRRNLELLLRKHGFEVIQHHHSGTFHGEGGKTIENMTVYARKL